MIKDILTAAGILAEQGRFLRQPKSGIYAVYFDDQDVDGPDSVPTLSARIPVVITHNVMVELYEDLPDPASEKSFERQLRAHGITHWAKEDREWLDDAGRYLVRYDEITYNTKE